MLSNECNPLFQEYFPFWEHLSPHEQDLLCRHTMQAKYSKGSILHNGSDDCVGMILLKSGQLRTYLLSEDGREITLFRLSAGDPCILSASCVMDAITFDVFVQAEENSEALLIPSPIFHQLMEQNIYVENFIYKLIAARFSDVMWAMQQILFMSFDRRLAIFLIDELSKVDGDTIKLTHEQIARYIGSAREVVSRMLKYFAQEGMVELSRGGVRILDKQKLRALT